jgi:hypothetical protein
MFSPDKIRGYRALAFLLYLISVCTAVRGQTHTVIRDGSVEIGVLAGDTIGGLVRAGIPLPNFNGFIVSSPGRGVLAVNTAFAASKSLLFYGQVSAFRGARTDRDLGAGFSATTNLLNLVYEAGFEKLFPVRRTAWAIYVLGAGATVQKRVDVLVNFADPNPAPPATEVFAGATRVRLKKAIFAPTAGGGLRYYFGRHFGLRVEAKSYFPTGDLPRAVGVASAGLFIAFPGRLQ